MTSDPSVDQLQALLEEIEALRNRLDERRRASHYPWDPTPIDEYNALLERARPLLPGPPVDPPPPLAKPPTGLRLWRTPTDDALQALDRLQAAIVTALGVRES